MLFESLTHLRALVFDGPDAQSFLQSQLTSDVRALRVHACQLTSWCNAQGRMISFGVLAQESLEKFFWVVPAGEAAQLLARLQVYKLRAKLSIALDTRELAGQFAPELVSLAEHEADYSLTDGRRFQLLQPALDRAREPASLSFLKHWLLADIRAKLPWSAGGERYVAQVLGLHTLGALSLSKGCYPGQEVIARIHYKGSVKRSLFHLISFDTGALACPISLSGADGSELGEVVQAVSDAQADTHLLCVLASDVQLPMRMAVNDRNIKLSLAC